MELPFQCGLRQVKGLIDHIFDEGASSSSSLSGAKKAFFASSTRRLNHSLSGSNAA